MPLPSPDTIFDAERISRLRQPMATALDTERLRELGAGVLARAIFTAEGTSAVYASKLKEVVDALAAGEISPGQARTALWETLKALGYTPEGGFPDYDRNDIPPALAGTIKDLSSFKRLDLIVETNEALNRGAGQLWRDTRPESLSAYPAWELYRVADRMAPRNWDGNGTPPRRGIDPRPRWTIAGGRFTDDGGVRRMIALIGDPVWGELGSYENFPDALGVDYPPFAFRSGMGVRVVSMRRCQQLGITGPDGETPEEWLQSGKAITLMGKVPLPAPRVSLQGVDPDLISRFRRITSAKPVQGRGAVMDYNAIFERDMINQNRGVAA